MNIVFSVAETAAEGTAVFPWQSMLIFVGVAIFCLAVGIAYASLKLYDEPVREWLKNHWLMRKK